MTQPDNQPLQTETLFSEPPTDYDAPPPPEPTGYPDEAYSDNPEPPPGPWEGAAPFEQPSPFQQINGKELSAMTFQPLQWAVPGLVQMGYSLVVAPPKTGKSYLAMGFALACATGGKALGCIDVERRPVLYLALEDTQRRLQTRAREMLGSEDIPPGVDFVTIDPRSGVKPTQAAAIDFIHGWVQQRQAVAPLVIVDTLSKVPAPRGKGSSNTYGDDYEEGAAWQRLAMDLNAAVFVVHHTNKNSSGGNGDGDVFDVIQAASGTQGITGACDTVLGIKYRRGDDKATLAMTSRDAPEGAYLLRRVGDTGWQLEGGSLAAAAEALREAAEQQRQSRWGDTRTKILQYVNNLPPGSEVTPQDVAEVLGDGTSSKVVGNRLGELAEDGCITRVGRGKYGPIQPVMGLD